MTGDDQENEAFTNGNSIASSRRSPDTVRVLVADDHEMVRQGLVTLIQRNSRIEVVGQAEDGVQALEMVCRLRPDVVLMDINMPRKNGLEATKTIRKRWPHIQEIGLSVQATRRR
ncbi:MAG: response regulator transcription factor [Kiritimatiellae bacterium]|jgi:YesN/AraC family two-component response regulator|nr:response regulator transcription factor [Kiritimatiellia bacterium]